MERAPCPVEVAETEEIVGKGPGAATGPRLCRFPRPAWLKTQGGEQRCYASCRSSAKHTYKSLFPSEHGWSTAMTMNLPGAGRTGDHLQQQLTPETAEASTQEPGRRSPQHSPAKTWS